MKTKNSHIEGEKKKFQLYEHPWLALGALIATTLFSILLSGSVMFGWIGLPDDSPVIQFLQGASEIVCKRQNRVIAASDPQSGWRVG